MTETTVEYVTDNQRIDRLVAEKVFGFREVNSVAYANDTTIQLISDWEPTSDIAQAFQVVERMRELGYDFFSEWETDDPAWALFTKSTNDNWDSGEDESPARAICLAALLALGVEVGGEE